MGGFLFFPPLAAKAPFIFRRLSELQRNRAYSRPAPRFLAGSTPTPVSERRLPPPAGEFSPAREKAGRGPGTGAPAAAPHGTGRALARKPSPGATRRALGRSDTSALRFQTRGARSGHRGAPRPASRPTPGPPGTRLAALTEQQQLDLARRLLAILTEVPVDHLTPLHRRLILGAQRTAHCARSESSPPLPPRPTSCLQTQVNSFFPGAGVPIPPDAGHETPPPTS